MKTKLTRKHLAVGLVVVSLFAMLLGKVNAYEDPIELGRRRRRADLAEFRAAYRGAYMLGHVQPANTRILHEYPKAITDTVDRLSLFGTDKWQHSEHHSTSSLVCFRSGPGHTDDLESCVSLADDDLVTALSKLDKATETLLLTSFHPAQVERQPEKVREQHFQVSEKMVGWMYEHMNDLALITGVHDAESRLRRYKEVRDLAAYASMIPRT